MTARSYLKFAGVTLIELLCVMAIIAILMSLLLGPITRAYSSARNKMWRIDATSIPDYIRNHLLPYYQTQTNYPAWTANQLYQKGVFDDRIMGFLRCPHVEYIPFASTDPTNKSVLTIDGYWLNEEKAPPNHTNLVSLMKMDVTNRRH